jgi:hypothetical protein
VDSSSLSEVLHTPNILMVLWVAKMKAKFIPKDYQIILFQRMHNLRQQLSSVKEYTEEFYKINIRVGHRESDDEKVARYMNGLRYGIQDEMSMITL